MRYPLRLSIILLTFSLVACHSQSSSSTSGEPKEKAAEGARDEKVYTITVDTNDTTSIQREVASAYQKGFRKIKIPAGVYRLPRPENSPWHIKFEDFKDCEIDATGVTFVCLGRDKRGVLFNYCDNLTFKGATFTRDIPPFSQGKIVAIDPDRNYVDIKIDKGYPTDIDDKTYFNFPVITLYQSGSRKLKPLVPDLYISKLERLSADSFRFFTRSKIDSRISVSLGDPAAWRSRSGGDFAVWSSTKSHFKDITITNGTGIGFYEICGAGENLYEHCVITYAQPPEGATDLPLLACATDGFHSSFMRKGPILDGCQFEGLNDDQVNINGHYAMAVDFKDATVIIDAKPVHSGARTRMSFADPGDLLRFYDRKAAFIGEAKVISVKDKEGYVESDPIKIESRTFKDRSKALYREVVLDHEVEGLVKGGLVANVNRMGSGFIIRNCVFKNNRAHGIFIRSSDGLIENNIVEGCMMGGILISPEQGSWNESDYAHNIIIRGNTIRNVALATQVSNSGISIIGFEFGNFVPLPGGHRNIQVIDNILEDNRGVNLVITSAIGVKVSGNKFIRPMHTPAYRIEDRGITNDKAIVWIREAADVQFENNVVIDPGQYFEKLVDLDSTVTAKGLDLGILLKK